MAKFELNDDAVSKLLDRLARLKAAEDFLEYKYTDATLPEKYGLGAETVDGKEQTKQSLLIEVRLAGQEKPLVLRVGKYLDDKKGYAAESSTLPKDIFLLPKTVLPTVREEGKDVDLIEAGWMYFAR